MRGIHAHRRDHGVAPVLEPTRFEQHQGVALIDRSADLGVERRMLPFLRQPLEPRRGTAPDGYSNGCVAFVHVLLMMTVYSAAAVGTAGGGGAAGGLGAPLPQAAATRAMTNRCSERRARMTAPVTG